MEGDLQRGDKVIVFWSNGTQNTGVMIHTAQGEGDLWGYKTDEGREFFINPYNPKFEAFERINEDDEVEQ